MNSTRTKSSYPRTMETEKITLIDCIMLDAEKRRLQTSNEYNFTRLESRPGDSRPETGNRHVSSDRLRKVLDEVLDIMDEFPFAEED